MESFNSKEEKSSREKINRAEGNSIGKTDNSGITIMKKD